MPPAFIDEIKRNITSNIPTASSIVGEVIKIIYDKKSNAADLALIIERDPPLTAEILKVANSSFYGVSSTIDSIKRAIVILGFDTIKELVTTMTTVHYFFNPRTPMELDRPGLWLHSVGTAKASQLIASRINFARPEVAYTVGLLHDLGKILLALSFPNYYRNVVQLAREKKCRIILAERKILNTDHSMIGKILCDLWSLPKDLSVAVFFHHDPMETPKGSQILAQIVHLGDYMCRKAKLGNPGDDVVLEPSQAVFHALGQKPDIATAKFNELFQEFMKMKDEVESYFSGLE